jgi:uncharacterized protein (DUF1800 family)
MDRITAQALIRFGLGPQPGSDLQGDPRAALRADLEGPDPALADPSFAGLPTGQDGLSAIRADNAARKALRVAGTLEKGHFKSQARQLYLADSTAQMDWAVNTPIGFRERLVWFWANHFTVSIMQGQTASLVGPFIREAIRPYVTGNFTDMVLAAESHPAMLRYLANDVSIGPDSPAGERTGRGLNENLGRECMELHTVGLAAGYTQADVTSMAKILTGWSIGTKDNAGDNTTGFLYRPRAHESGPQTVMGRTFDGGEQAGIDALTFLSTYPTTYQLLAQKLVTHFVADTPPPDDIARIAGVLRDSGGDLGAAAAALIDLPSAWVAGQKLKTPMEYVVSAMRVAPPPAGQPPVNYANVLNQMGQPLWSAPLPNGWADQASGWDGSDAVMTRIDWAYTYAARFDTGATGAQPADVADAALGPILQPATANAMASAGSRREALTLLFASPEFQRR